MLKGAGWAQALASINKAADTAVLLNPMSFAGINVRGVLNASYDTNIIYNE